ncbi:MAG: RNA pseudouridine synthase [Treponema sp.]|nr:RNA pseudouridine synthase [Treponema sp.]
MVLNKPPGLPVQGGEGVTVSLDSLLAETCAVRPFLVHRLDRDTSGLILVAKDREAAAGFSALFGSRRAGNGTPQDREKGVIKQYQAVCSGLPSPAQGLIRLSLDVRGRELESETFYTLLSSWNAGGRDFSHLDLELGTGRMHQIRRHLARIGCPVLGDDKYGDFRLNKTLRKTLGLKRLLLHASRLFLPPFPPLVPEGLDISAPLPDYFESFLVHTLGPGPRSD